MDETTRSILFTLLGGVALKTAENVLPKIIPSAADLLDRKRREGDRQHDELVLYLQSVEKDRDWYRQQLEAANAANDTLVREAANATAEAERCGREMKSWHEYYGRNIDDLATKLTAQNLELDWYRKNNPWHPGGRLEGRLQDKQERPTDDRIKRRRTDRPDPEQ